MTVDFRERAASALTHPLTLASLGTLLLNDIVLKRLWPGAWVPGKLSDLAWMVFAPPLLAYLLSLAVPRRHLHRAGHAGFLTAYVGLPLLYAAFNSFTPVHDAILRGLALVGGSGPGSPLDATDSLVIPLAMAAAVWVWNKPSVNADAVRARLTLLTVAIAVLASVATSEETPNQGIVRLGSWEGVVNAHCYESVNGGMTWRHGTGLSCQGGIFTSVETPRGRYLIFDTDIDLVRGDFRETVYSTAYLRKGSNYWQQERMTTELGFRDLTTAPKSIIYDEYSGNIVVAMGLQGVVVGTPDGTWTRVAVGRYRPTDFSLSGKMSALKEPAFLLAVLVLSLSLGNWSLTVARARVKKRFGAPAPTHSDPSGGRSINRIIDNYMDALYRKVCSRTTLACFVVGIALMGAVFVGVYPRSFPYPEATTLAFWRSPQAIFGILVFLLAVGGIVLNRQNSGQIGALTVFIVGMYPLASLCFLLWLQVDVPLVFADFAVFVLVSLAACGLRSYLMHAGSRRSLE